MLNKAAFLTVVLFFLIASAFLFLAEGRCGQDNDNALIVYGLGYPPIRAQSLAQARLMARRAAIIDAYRNALAETGVENYSEDALYTGLSGFVKELTITNEEYLEDGGIRITARVPLQNVKVSSAGIERASKQPGWTGREPIRITLERWYKIIKQSVRIE